MKQKIKLSLYILVTVLTSLSLYRCGKKSSSTTEAKATVSSTVSSGKF